MGDKSLIEWTDATWNPIAAFDRETGKRGWFCTKVSDGCTNCYAESLNKRLGTGHLYRHKNAAQVETRLVMMDKPVKWTKPRMIFVNSMTDIAGEFVTDEQIWAIWEVMEACPWHTFQVLTKRMDRLAWWLNVHRPEPLPNVWVGTSVENEAAANDRIQCLLDTPAAVRWLSCEPLLGPLDLSACLAWLDWVVVGGESGRNARPMHPAWARSLRDQCVRAGTAFHFKQWGAWAPVAGVYEEHEEDGVVDEDHVQSRLDDVRDRAVIALEASGAIPQRLHPNDFCHYQPNGSAWWMARTGKKAAGRVLDGRTWDQYPEAA